MPYYFALAPNYDFTFHPRYLSNYGMLWQGDWRHRLANGQYTIKVAAIDQGGAAHGSVIDEGWRGSVQTKGQFSLSSWWRFGWDVTADSDDSFRRFYQLDPILQTDRVNTVYLQGMSDRNYFAAKLYQFGGLLLTDTPYSNAWVHPVIDYNYIVGAPVLGGELSFNAHARSMTRSDSTDTNRVVRRGQLAAQDDRSRSARCGRRSPTRAATSTTTRDARRSRHAAADPGRHGAARRRRRRRALLLPVRGAHGVGSHVIAPTAQIIVRQNQVDQRRLPDEDAKSLIFDDTLLFDIDKFSGYDRFETGTRANVGLQYTLQAINGIYGRAVFGQSFQLAGENPYVNPGLDPTGKPSTSRRSAASRPTAPTTSPASICRRSRASAHHASPASTRRTGACAATTRSSPAATARCRARWPTPSRISIPMLGLIDNQQEIMPSLALKLTNHWTCRARCATTSMRGPHPGLIAL